MIPKKKVDDRSSVYGQQRVQQKECWLYKTWMMLFRSVCGLGDDFLGLLVYLLVGELMLWKCLPVDCARSLLR